jgi:hypothetical protein
MLIVNTDLNEKPVKSKFITFYIEENDEEFIIKEIVENFYKSPIKKDSKYISKIEIIGETFISKSDEKSLKYQTIKVLLNHLESILKKSRKKRVKKINLIEVFNEETEEKLTVENSYKTLNLGSLTIPHEQLDLASCKKEVISEIHPANLPIESISYTESSRFLEIRFNVEFPYGRKSGYELGRVTETNDLIKKYTGFTENSTFDWETRIHLYIWNVDKLTSLQIENIKEVLNKAFLKLD